MVWIAAQSYGCRLTADRTETQQQQQQQHLCSPLSVHPGMCRASGLPLASYEEESHHRLRVRAPECASVSGADWLAGSLSACPSKWDKAVCVVPVVLCWYIARSRLSALSVKFQEGNTKIAEAERDLKSIFSQVIHHYFFTACQKSDFHSIWMSKMDARITLLNFRISSYKKLSPKNPN